MRKGAKYREAVLRKHEEKIDSDDSKERDDRQTTVFILLLILPTTNRCVPKLSLLHNFWPSQYSELILGSGLPFGAFYIQTIRASGYFTVRLNKICLLYKYQWKTH